MNKHKICPLAIVQKQIFLKVLTKTYLSKFDYHKCKKCNSVFLLKNFNSKKLENFHKQLAQKRCI